MTTGKSKMGSNTSRARVWIAIAENRVPTPARPMVPRSITPASSGRSPADRLNSTTKMGKMMSSTTAMKSTLPSILPR